MQTQNEPELPNIDPVQPETPNSQPPENERQTKTADRQPGAKDVQPETENGQTPPNKGGRPKKDAPDDTRLTIRGVDRETRAAIGKASKKLGKTQGDFFNQDIRELCNGILSKKSEPPASPADVQGMIAAEIATAQPAMINEIVQRLAEVMQQSKPQEKKGLFARLFG